MAWRALSGFVLVAGLAIGLATGPVAGLAIQPVVGPVAGPFAGPVAELAIERALAHAVRAAAGSASATSEFDGSSAPAAAVVAYDSGIYYDWLSGQQSFPFGGGLTSSVSGGYRSLTATGHSLSTVVGYLYIFVGCCS